jgi:hypothetical protein
MIIRRIRQPLERFLFFPESDLWISTLRIGAALQLISFCLALRKDWDHLLSITSGGFIGRDLMESTLNAESSLIPRLGWLVEAAGRIGLSETTALWLTWTCLLLSGLLLLIGLFSRASAITAWLLHLGVVKSAGLLSYGVDNLTTIVLFYLMISPLPDRFSLDSVIRHRSGTPDLVSFFRRILQIHVCFIYFFTGFSKLAGTGWWDGSNLWRALTMPPFHFVQPEVVLRFKTILPPAGVLICLLEFGYPFFIWSRMTRNTWLICVCGMHMMIGLTMGMYLFAFIMIVLNLAAFFPFNRVIVRTRPNTGADADSTPAPASVN